ncbi:hypothetical protein CY34DRAFT_60397, partial [Suillus luteus UH-Slu-Lm8-n1]
TFESHSRPITCVDIALDSTLLVSRSWDVTARIWSLKTGKLVAGPFRNVDWVGAVLLSTDSKKLAVKSWTGRWLEICDVKTETSTLNGHDKYIRSISYFPDGRRMISGSWDKSALQWDLQTGKEIQEARNICERGIWTVAVSRDGRWAITGGGGLGHGELKVIEVETGIVKQFEGHSRGISSIDISADSNFLASGSWDRTTRIWNLGTGELVAGPFESIDWVGAVRFSPDSKKLAVKSEAGKCLEVWDVHT